MCHVLSGDEAGHCNQ